MIRDGIKWLTFDVHSKRMVKWSKWVIVYFWDLFRGYWLTIRIWILPVILFFSFVPLIRFVSRCRRSAGCECVQALAAENRAKMFGVSDRESTSWRPLKIHAFKSLHKRLWCLKPQAQACTLSHANQGALSSWEHTGTYPYSSFDLRCMILCCQIHYSLSSSKSYQVSITDTRRSTVRW